MNDQHRRPDSGFTLIELLVVIIIIGILAAIAIPVYLSQRAKGVDATMKSDARTAAVVVETWMTDDPTAAVIATTVTHPGVGTSAGSLPRYKPSGGNTVTVSPGALVGTYCIEVTNPASSQTGAILHDSTRGGLQPGFHPAGCS